MGNKSFLFIQSRFNDDDYVNDIPAPGEYKLKNSMADTLPKENVRSGAFGTKDAVN